MEHADDVLLLHDLPLSRKVRIARVALDLRRGDVAFLGTQELARRGLPHMKLTEADLSWVERGFTIRKERLAALLAVLGLGGSPP